MGMLTHPGQLDDTDARAPTAGQVVIEVQRMPGARRRARTRRAPAHAPALRHRAGGLAAQRRRGQPAGAAIPDGAAAAGRPGGDLVPARGGDVGQRIGARAVSRDDLTGRVRRRRRLGACVGHQFGIRPPRPAQAGQKRDRSRAPSRTNFRSQQTPAFRHGRSRQNGKSKRKEKRSPTDSDIPPQIGDHPS